MKNIFVGAFLLSLSTQIDATVKTFVNDSAKTFTVRVYSRKLEERNDQSRCVEIKLAAGGVEDLFIQDPHIYKILIEDEQNKQHQLASFAHTVIKEPRYALNSNDIFIIQPNAHVKTYKRSTSRDAALQKIDQAYVNRLSIPGINISIENAQGAHGLVEQKIIYTT